MWMRLLSVRVVPSARDHVTLGSGRPDTQQLKRTVCPATQRLGRSRALNCGADVISSLRRRNDAIDVLVCTDSRSSVNDARSKLEFADARDSQSAPASQQASSLIQYTTIPTLCWFYVNCRYLGSKSQGARGSAAML